jgi:hypothetical protein
MKFRYCSASTDSTTVVQCGNTNLFAQTTHTRDWRTFATKYQAFVVATCCPHWAYHTLAKPKYRKEDTYGDLRRRAQGDSVQMGDETFRPTHRVGNTTFGHAEMNQNQVVHEAHPSTKVLLSSVNPGSPCRKNSCCGHRHYVTTD